MEASEKESVGKKVSKIKRRKSLARRKKEKNNQQGQERKNNDNEKSSEPKDCRKRRFKSSTDNHSEDTIAVKRTKQDTGHKATESPSSKEVKTGRKRKRKRKRKMKTLTSQPSESPTVESSPKEENGTAKKKKRRKRKKKEVATEVEPSQKEENGVAKETRKRKRKRKKVDSEGESNQTEENGVTKGMGNQQRKRQKIESEEENETDGPMLSKIKHLDVVPKHKTKYEKSVELRAKMVDKLNAARFRYINEQLYTTSGAEALQSLGKDKEAFTVYHQGYSSQVSKWPINPVDKIIGYIKKMPPTTVIADFGCGEAKIAQSVPNTVFSFDLVAMNKYVIECDMAQVPLEDDSVDVVVFCLSLMGTNLVDFLTEANRILCLGGVLKIAEVASRFDSVKNFVRALKRLGFMLHSKDLSSKYFFLFEFKKFGKAENWSSLYGLDLKPCLYKKR